MHFIPEIGLLLLFFDNLSKCMPNARRLNDNVLSKTDRKLTV